MLWILTITLFVWTLTIGREVSHGVWDAFILACWINWPLIFCNILAHAKHRSQATKFWRLKKFSDFLLLGAYIPLLIGIAIFNIVLTLKVQQHTVEFDEKFFFVTYASVLLWGATAVSVFGFYLASKFVRKRNAR